MNARIIGSPSYWDNWNCDRIDEVLNNILKSLVEHDSLELKRCGWFERILQHVYVDRGFQTGVALFPAPFPRSYEHDFSKTMGNRSRASFTVKEDGTAIAWPDCSAQRSLLTLPHRVFERVVNNLIAFSGGGFTLDFDNRTFRGIDRSILQVNRKIRKKNLSLNSGSIWIRNRHCPSYELEYYHCSSKRPTPTLTQDWQYVSLFDSGQERSKKLPSTTRTLKSFEGTP
jgi:hypothetical protein